MIDLELEILAVSALNQSAFPIVIEHAGLFIAHRNLYDTMYAMYDDDVAFTFPSIHARLAETKGADYANKIISHFGGSTGSTISLRDYIAQLQRLRRRERVRDLAVTISEGMRRNTLALEQIEELITAETEQLQAYTPDDGELLTDYAQKPLDEIFPVGAAYKTGIAELDEKLFGIKPGQLMIIAARPSKGKTALMLQAVEHIAKHGEGDGPVLIFSMDATKDELYSRMLARRSRVPSWKIEYQKETEAELERVVKAHEYFRGSGLNIKMYDALSDINSIKAQIRKHKDVKAVVVDYLQQISGDKSGSREAEVSGITRTCKNMAMYMRIPFILLSQLNRAIEISNREPILSDLRESGAIEQDANIVLFIHSGDDERQKEIEDSAFYLAKNKNGRTGKIKTNFNKPYYEFGLMPDERMDWTNN